jgi:hypothetical protein
MAKTVKRAKKTPAAKKAAKPAIAKAAKAKTAKTAMNGQMHSQPDNFMTRLLKKKEAERMAQNQRSKNSNFAMHSSHTQLPTGNQGFGRFNGPRRKAA